MGPASVGEGCHARSALRHAKAVVGTRHFALKHGGGGVLGARGGTGVVAARTKLLGPRILPLEARAGGSEGTEEGGGRQCEPLIIL